MALFFHSDDVDQLIPFPEAVAITENALRDLVSPKGVNAPRKRLNLHRELGEGKFDTVLNIYTESDSFRNFVRSDAEQEGSSNG